MSASPENFNWTLGASGISGSSMEMVIPEGAGAGAGFALAGDFGPGLEGDARCFFQGGGGEFGESGVVEDEESRGLACGVGESALALIVGCDEGGI